MQVPEFIGMGEMMSMFDLSKTRISQIVNRKDFPDHYIHLQMGRIWRLGDVLDWAQQTGRRFTLTVPGGMYRSAGGKGTGNQPTVPLATVSQGTGGPLIRLPKPATTISSGEEQRTETTGTSVGKTDELEEPGGGGPGEGDAARQSSRLSGELNKLALAEDWDRLEAVYKAAKNDEPLPESDIELVGFATMVILSNATVPNYRVSKRTMTRAWNDVRAAYDPTPLELVKLATYLMTEADSPFISKAVKRFSDFEIAKIRRQAKKADDGRAQIHRWQGAHGSHEELIAKMTPEQRKRFGVDPK